MSLATEETVKGRMLSALLASRNPLLQGCSENAWLGTVWLKRTMSKKNMLIRHKVNAINSDLVADILENSS